MHVELKSAWLEKQLFLGLDSHRKSASGSTKETQSNMPLISS